MTNHQKTTADVSIPNNLIDQILGQKAAVDVVKLAARQQRFLLIVGEPGTGKSMLGRALAELMPFQKAEDILARSNPCDHTQPKIEVLPQGDADKKLKNAHSDIRSKRLSTRFIFNLAMLATIIVTAVQVFRTQNYAYILGGIIVFVCLAVVKNWAAKKSAGSVPKILVNNKDVSRVPFVDATGTHQGGLLGDVRHDPYQSGGSESPQHQLLEAGAIHRANKGVLFIDEMSTLTEDSQQNLLTAIQQKELAITGRNVGSSGTMVRSEAVPCDFTLVLAGNEEDLGSLHPALRSRIQGFGYEIYTQSMIEDKEENTAIFWQFVAQEVARDKKIPHFDASAVRAVIDEARRRAGRSGFLSTRFRELGGLVRAAGDLAVQEGQDLVNEDLVTRALPLVRSLEDQRYHYTADNVAAVANKE
jgi:Lon-like ATP-dependent protease